MTTQFLDGVTFDGTEFSLDGVRGDLLFEPARFGFRPTVMHSACRRGFLCKYGFRDQEFILERLVVRDIRADSTGWCAPQLNGRRHSQKGDHDSALEYDCLDMKIDVTASLLLMAGRPSTFLLPPRRFHSAWQAGRVVELWIRDGKLVDHRDLSSKMQSLREHAASAGEDPSADVWSATAKTLDSLLHHYDIPQILVEVTSPEQDAQRRSNLDAILRAEM
jgi:hypothetical protein